MSWCKHWDADSMQNSTWESRGSFLGPSRCEEEMLTASPVVLLLLMSESLLASTSSLAGVQKPQKQCKNPS